MIGISMENGLKSLGVNHVSLNFSSYHHYFIYI